MYPDPCGERFAEAVRNGADPNTVVPNDYVIVRGGATDMPTPGTPFSGAAGPDLAAAAAALPHGALRATNAGSIRQHGGMVTWEPEISRYGTVNQQHVNINEAGVSSFGELLANPVQRRDRIDGRRQVP